MKTLNPLFLITCLLYLSVLIQPIGVTAQITFERWYGNIAFDAAHDVQQTNDDGYILTGSFTAAPGSRDDLWLIKTDVQGEMEWDRKYGSEDFDEGHAVLQASAGGFVVGGWTRATDPDHSDAWLLRTDEAGDTLWTRIFGQPGGRDEIFAMTETTDGGFVLCGLTYVSDFRTDLLLMKVDAGGHLIWSKPFGSDFSFDVGHDIIKTDDENYAVCGSKNSSSIWLLKFDPSGDLIWEKTFPEYVGEGKSLQQTDDGGFIIAGFSSNPTLDRDARLIKTDSIGNLEWSQAYGVAENLAQEEARSVVQTAGGDYLFAGYQIVPMVGGDLWLVRTDEVGTELWSKTFGEFPGDDEAYTIRHTSDGGFVIAGFTGSKGSGDDAYLIKLDGNGDLVTSILRPSLTMLEVRVAPNPFRDYVDFTITPNMGNVKICFLNMLGQITKVVETGGSDNLRISNHYLSRGVNYFQVISNGELISVGKVIML